MPQRIGREQRVRARGALRRAHRRQRDLVQQVDSRSRIAAHPEADGEIGVLDSYPRFPVARRGLVPQFVDKRAVGRKAQLDFRVSGGEALQPGHQPPRGECRGDGKDENALRSGRANHVHRLPEPVEPFAQQGEAAPRNLSQLDRAPETTEERRVQVVLEKLDLTADRAGGHVQFPGRFGKTEVVRRRLERP
jgi:hypothetical protein